MSNDTGHPRWEAFFSYSEAGGIPLWVGWGDPICFTPARLWMLDLGQSRMQWDFAGWLV
jgi:hypothetical protein